MNESQRRYNASDKGKACRKRFNQTLKGRETQARASQAYRARLTHRIALQQRLDAIHARLRARRPAKTLLEYIARLARD